MITATSEHFSARVRVSRACFGVSPKQSLEVREREDASAGGRNAHPTRDNFYGS
jgi:hypothetical protein